MVMEMIMLAVAFWSRLFFFILFRGRDIAEHVTPLITAAVLRGGYWWLLRQIEVL